MRNQLAAALVAMLGLFDWNPVNETCPAGGLFALPIHYDIRWNVRRILGWQPCDPADPQVMCPVYSLFQWTEDSAWMPPYDPREFDLAPGEVLTWEVTTVDGQGREDCGCPGGGPC